tara:strand:+ start:1621 stop:1788 length:168 start_codon:yes stop_codon:yes gene_type:complete
MIKTIGNYEVKLTGTSNLITVYKNNELIFGKTVSAQDTGSAFNSICEQITKKIKQ